LAAPIPESTSRFRPQSHSNTRFAGHLENPVFSHSEALYPSKLGDYFAKIYADFTKQKLAELNWLLMALT
jgi:hypothetical protein